MSAKCLAAVAAACVAAAQLTLDTFDNTVFAPPAAATRTSAVTLAAPEGTRDFSALRFTGTLTSPATQLVTFSCVLDGFSGLRLWLDSHLLIDARRGSRGGDGVQALPMLLGTPVTLRAEYTRYNGTGEAPALALHWRGNATAPSEVPTAAYAGGPPPAWEGERAALRARLQNPAVAWQTWTINMAAFVLMPQGTALSATLADLVTGEVLGDVAVFRGFSPAEVRPGPHSYTGDYTEMTIGRWGTRACDVRLQSTVLLPAQSLVWLAEANGTDCAGLVLQVAPRFMWGYAGTAAFGADNETASSIVASAPGFADVRALLLAGSLVVPPPPPPPPPPPMLSVTTASGVAEAPACNLTGTWCCDTTTVVQSAGGALASVAAYGNGTGAIVGTAVNMSFSNHAEPYLGTADAPSCDTVFWMDGSQWTRVVPQPTWRVRLAEPGAGAGLVLIVAGAAAAPMTLATARVAIDAAAARTDAWLDAAFGAVHRAAFEPVTAVLAWDTVFTPYVTAVTASSRLWDCLSPNCDYTQYALFDWDMPIVAWTWADPTEAAAGRSFAKDMAYAQVVEDLYTRTLEGFVPNLSSGTYATVDRTQPPLFAFVAMSLFRRHGEAWLLEAALPPLLSYLDFLWRYRRGAGAFADQPDGRAALLSWGSNLFCCGGDAEAHSLLAAGYESGLDNSPMWDGAAFDAAASLMTVYDVGATGLFLSETHYTMEIARALGRADLLPALGARFNATRDALNAHLWSEAHGAYVNAHFNGTLSPRIAPTNFYPLMAGPDSGAVPPARAAAMAALLASPRGFCLNDSYRGPGGPDAVAVSRWRGVGDAGTGGWSDSVTCVGDACVGEVTRARYGFAAAERAVLLAGGGPGRVPLYSWFSSAYNDTALTASAAAGPDATYALRRLEAHCLAAPPPPPAAPSWPVTAWRLGWDRASCVAPECEAALAGLGYARDDSGGGGGNATLCWAVAVRDVGDFPCRFGAPSIARADPAFGDNAYWRGRIWPATEGTLYWALRPWAGRGFPALDAARASLARQALDLATFHWAQLRAVCENAHGVLGTCGEQGQSDDPLLNWSGVGAFLSIVEAGLW